MSPEVVWTIAGFDPSSGAGVTADLMTFAAHGLFGCSAITALTVQSTMGVAGIELVRPELLARTLAHLADDLPPTGVKIGMLGSPEHAAVVAEFLAWAKGPAEDDGERRRPWVVLDPVLRSSSGRELYPVSGLPLLHEKLLPLVDTVTPNWGELELLAGLAVHNDASAERAARALMERHAGLDVVATGGDQTLPTDLVFLHSGERFAFSGEHVATDATHGTGCAFSSALLSGLVLGRRMDEAAAEAKQFVTGALRAAPGVGHGKGPMGLLWNWRREASQTNSAF